MATFKKLASGKWQAQVARAGIRKSKSFPSKREAQDWATAEEHRISSGASEQAAKITFGSVMDRYAREESVKKKGARWEIVRLERLKNDTMAGVLLADLDETVLADWRDRRLLEVAPASVNREMVLLSAVLNVAKKEWRLLTHNPISDVRKPTKPPPRDRRVSVAELEKMIELAGADLSKKQARAIHAFRFAIETAMRAGEILSLTAERVDLEKRVAELPVIKNGSSRRVPLSSEAVRLIEALPKSEGSLFDLDSASLDVLFRKVRDKAEISGLTFHDSRHEATTRLAKKMDVLPLARVTGHKDLKMLLGYYNETAEDLAKLLD